MVNRRFALSALSAIICFVVFLIIDITFGGITDQRWSVIPALSAGLAVALITYLLQTPDPTT